LANSKKFKKIGILKGGISDEFEISSLTANEVFNILKKKYLVHLIDVDNDCKKFVSNILNAKPDIIFNCLHGFFGEDGQVQSILNYLKIPYTHSNVFTSSLAMNKHFSKIFFEKIGVKSPNGRFLKNMNLSEKMNFPQIIKPICGGSSNGLIKVNSQRELKEFSKNKQFKPENLIIEEFIPGREITVGILENKICGIMEIIFDSDIYDYKNKYIKIAKHILNPKLPKDIKKELKDISLLVHKEMNCNCLSRLDFRYNEKNNKLYLLELNTQPGLTKNSLLPEMALSKGKNFLELCEIILSNPICPEYF